METRLEYAVVMLANIKDGFKNVEEILSYEHGIDVKLKYEKYMLEYAISEFVGMDEPKSVWSRIDKAVDRALTMVMLDEIDARYSETDEEIKEHFWRAG
jgi:hypothetical protein